MPISYRIDESRNLVLTAATGVLTDAEVLEHKERLLRDPEFRHGMAELTDVRAVARLEVTPEGIRRMVGFDSREGAGTENHRLAIVASHDFIFGMARMYQTQAELYRPEVGVFRTLDEALGWLGMR